MSQNPVKLAFALCAAQEGKCFYCGVRFTGPRAGERWIPTQWTRDHIRPQAGGNGNSYNVVLACQKCNNEKADRPPTQEQLERAARMWAKALNIGLAFHGDGLSWWREAAR